MYSYIKVKYHSLTDELIATNKKTTKRMNLSSGIVVPLMLML